MRTHARALAPSGGGRARARVHHMHTHTHVHIGADSPPGVTLRLCVHIASARVHCAASAPARETACEPIRSTAGAASVNAHETTASHITMVDTKRNALPRRDVGVRERALAPSLQFVMGQTHVVRTAQRRVEPLPSVRERACPRTTAWTPWTGHRRRARARADSLDVGACARVSRRCVDGMDTIMMAIDATACACVFARACTSVCSH